MNKLFRSLVPLLLLACLTPAFAKQEAELVSVGIPATSLENLAAPDTWGRQRGTKWCWAACLQMVLNLEGLPAAQEELVKGLYGERYDLPANLPQMVQLTSRLSWRTDAGRTVRLSPKAFYYVAPEDIAASLAAGLPWIAALATGNGGAHAYVLTDIQFLSHPVYGRSPVLVVLRDPWPDYPSRIEVPWQTFVQSLTGMLEVIPFLQ